ncbi:glycoside hydrolase family 28 protein [Mariniphaga sediminis]|uniref:Glycoside hydrolase family 28 protein n=1 Tax=Mariniphaga sediminis TaxID=1628158 RepID=A0A399CUN3_9BACT|nr:glycoside hydrolase family 28 protein [Mariniphaga sediminis]RIH62838.1 glycoside hydrolase family 28 protein [Mariniphaga sediminis]
MRKILLLLSGNFIMLTGVFVSCFTSAGLAPGNPRNLIVPPESATDSTITLLWDKPADGDNTLSYQVYQNGNPIAEVEKTNYTVECLTPGKSYTFSVKAKNAEGKLSDASNQVVQSTKKKGQIYNILAYGAIGNGKTKNTEAIQKAIDDCTPGGIVYIPSGKFISGALFLKSNMTLYIAEGGVLKGSLDINDYYPMIPNRFEGWELESFASLINAGKMDHSGGYNVSNLSIRGKGVISGGGTALAKAMIDARGLRGRGRLICLMNCENVNIQGLIIEESPCWTIHYIYSKNITCHDLTINSSAANGDGIDPDSSTDSYIFNCTFSTGDDCIAIKSGKNPEGYYIAKPTKNIFISDCKFISGHSLAIGSEMSGGVENIVIRDCELENLIYGLQIKATRDRGGYVKGIYVQDCNLQKIRIFTSVEYNNDGEPAPVIPYLKDMEFSNLDMLEADTSEPVILIDGYPEVSNYTANILFNNILLPEKSIISVNLCKDFNFKNVLTKKGNKPEYIISNSKNILR